MCRCRELVGDGLCGECYKATRSIYPGILGAQVYVGDKAHNSREVLGHVRCVKLLGILICGM